MPRDDRPQSERPSGPPDRRCPRFVLIVRSVLGDLARIGIGLLVAVLVAEVGLRIVPPSVPIQIVRPGPSVGLRRGPGGVPVWGHPHEPSTRCLRERPEAARVLVVGDSIFAGPGGARGHDAPTRMGAHLLRLPGPPSCVVNRAVPGFTLDAKVATFRENLASDRPEVVVFEAWANDAHPYRFLGDSAYALVDLETDPEGWPEAFGLPAGLSHGLFRHSRLYETLTLRLADRASSTDPTVERVAERIGREIIAPARAAGAQTVVVTAVALDRPLSGAPADFEVAAQRVAEREGAAYVSLRELLADQPVERIRLDTCCHFTEAANDLIARRLAPLVARVLRDRSTRGNLLRTAGR